MPELNLVSMRKAGRILKDTLRFITEDFIAPGITSLDISRKSLEIINSYEGASAAFLGYNGFSGAACVSINEEVVHGSPRADKIVKEGDIVSVDCGVCYDGHFSDACRTVAIGDVDIRAKKLIKITQEALNKGIEAALPGNSIGDISYAIQRHVERNRFSVSLEFVGHGIGLQLHGPPQVPNYGPPGIGDTIEVGTCLAIEPVVFDGPTDYFTKEDGWTVVSREGNLYAHFEDTVLIGTNGPEILTR